MTTDITTNNTQNKLNVFELLATRTNDKTCKLADIKDKCEPVPYGTLEIYSAKNGTISDSSDTEIAKEIVAECISWNKLYLISFNDEIIAESYDGLSIHGTGECLRSFCFANKDATIKEYTQFICIHDDKPVIISVSPYGTKKFKQYLASMMMIGSDSTTLNIKAVNEKGNSKAFTFLDVKLV